MRERIRDRIVDLYEEGYSPTEISDEIGCSIGSVGANVYALKLNKIPENREAQARRKIENLIEEYETEFGKRFPHRIQWQKSE